jgi:20S proteasome alpha/beta subunit
MSAKEIYELAAKSVRASIGRDAGSGNGIDLLLYTQEGLKAEETLPV